jgi:prepilin-type processing-associated H-X9-DG protein
MMRIIVRYCVIVIIGIGILGLIYPKGKRNSHAAPCQSNLKQIGLAIFEYAYDHNEKFPPAIISGRPTGWANVVQPYLKSYTLFQCPNEEHPQQKVPQPAQAGFTDYWLNLNLSGIKEENVVHAESTIMLGEGDGGSPESTARYALDHFTVPWLQSSDSPLKRHLDGANYAFADGHVKWFKPEEISQQGYGGEKPIYTFRVK